MEEVEWDLVVGFHVKVESVLKIRYAKVPEVCQHIFWVEYFVEQASVLQLVGEYPECT